MTGRGRFGNWSEWIAEKFTDWLSSPIGLLQGIVITLPWLIVVGLGYDPHGFWFLFFATLVSFLTQFPLAYAARRAERHTLKLMRLMVALAEEILKEQEDQEAQLEEIGEKLVGSRDLQLHPPRGVPAPEREA